MNAAPLAVNGRSAPGFAPPEADAAEIRRTLDTLFPQDEVIELRALHKARKRTDAGYFDCEHRDELVREAMRLNAAGAAVYVTLNRIDPQILARCANRIQEWAKDTATDSNVTRRLRLLVDLDPRRPKDTSSTAEQLEAVRVKTRAVYSDLASRGWPKPVVAESGNGMHLVYGVDLPNDDASRDLVKHCLEALAARYDDAASTVDTSVFNAARIVKLHGTVANKGDDIPMAPWRLSRLVSVPDSLEVVTQAQLEALAAEVPAEQSKQKAQSVQARNSGQGWQADDMGRFLARAGIEATGPDHHEGALRWKLKVCPFNDSHGYGESAVFLRPDGRLGFECRHNSCQGKHWQDLRELVDGPRESRRPHVVERRDYEPAVTVTGPARPLPSALPDVKAFDVDLLPSTVRAWVEDCSAGIQAPLDFAAVATMAGLGGTIGRQIGIAPKARDLWVERPLMWAGAVGRPSSGKSPTLQPVRSMLAKLEAEGAEAFESVRKEYEAHKIVAEAAKDNARKAARKVLEKGGSRAQAMEGAEYAIEADVEEPQPPRLVVNDATVEKLGEVLNGNPRGLIMFRDELSGWLASLDREGREGDRSFWLECWNGTGRYTVDRIGRGTFAIEACAVSVLGGIQPGKLAEYVRGAVRGGFSDDGLIQRFGLIVYPDLPKDWRYMDRAPNKDAQRQAWETFQRLNRIDPHALGAERHDIIDVPFLRFDDTAQGLFIEWQTDLMKHLRSGSEPAFLESHFAKYPALVARLALVIHLAENGAGPVSGEALAKALDWSEYLKTHARRVYAPIINNGVTAAHALLGKRQELNKPFTAREVYLKGWTGLTDRETATEGLEVLAEYGYLQEMREPAGSAGGRPTIRYRWRADA